MLLSLAMLVLSVGCKQNKDEETEEDKTEQGDLYTLGSIQKKDTCFWRNITHRDLMEHRVKLDSECSH